MSQQSDMDINPRDRAEEITDDALSIVQELAGSSTATERAKAEDKAVERLADGISDCLIDGLNMPVGRYAKIIAKKCDYYSVTNIKNRVAETVESKEMESGDTVLLDEFILESLDEVRITRTTDRKQGTLYTWDFGGFTIETQGGSERRGHYSWENMRDYIFEAGEMDVGKPRSERRDGGDWRDFIVDVVADRKRVSTVRGPRTRALEELRNHIKRSTGFGTVETAVDRGGVWVVRKSIDVPDWWQAFSTDTSEMKDLTNSHVREVRVHENDIEAVTDNQEISRQAFYHELKARGLTVQTESGTSMQEWVDGGYERFWTLRPDLATPRRYVADPRADDRVIEWPLFCQDDAQEWQDEMQADTTDFGEVGAHD